MSETFASPDEHESLDGPVGKQMLAYAIQQGHCVLEFKEEDGELTIADVTEHLKALEEKVNEN
jgi:hypothetical protein